MPNPRGSWGSRTALREVIPLSRWLCCGSEYRVSSQGLFVGLTTLDSVYRVETIPQTNQKQTATDWMMAAGGPATNAAVTFRHLGHRARVVSALGCHPMNTLIQTDLMTQGVAHFDLTPTQSLPPPLSAILVTPPLGDRAVVSRNAIGRQATVPESVEALLEDISIVLVDGHQLEVGRAIVQAAQQRQIPVVLDGGSWKSDLESLLPFVTYAICSADFYPPGCTSRDEVFDYWMRVQPTVQVAITDGAEPIAYLADNSEVAAIQHIVIPAITPVDTLGAGDVFHGAFCHWILRQDFRDALASASQIAAIACTDFGTRAWLPKISDHFGDGVV